MPASKYFSLSLCENPQIVTITMYFHGSEMTTAKMPHTAVLLKKELPTILRSKCFNEKNIPFSKELLSTELGHLFEHILLEYLCILKIGTGFQSAVFSGITKWDWNNDPYGTFHIEVSLDKEDRIFFTPALQKASNLFEKIILYHQKSIFQEKDLSVMSSYFLDAQQNR